MNQPFTPILLADCNRQSSRKRARRGASEGEKGRITIHRSPPATPRAARRWLGSAAVAAVCFALMRAGLPPAQAAAAGNWYERGKLGLFDHYCFGGSAYAETIYPNGALPVDLNQCANAFNAQQLADDASAFGVDYVILTAMHANLNLLYPSAKMDHWRPGHSANRDVIQACIDALKPKGIKLALYIHATDGTDFTPADQLATGWNNATNHYAVWNAFINDIFAELGNRYGTNLDGYWLDMVFSSEFQTRIDKTRLKATMLLGNADRILIGNGARADGSDGPEYSSLEYYPPDSDTVGVASQIATIASAGNWWATLPAGRNGAKYTPEQLFRSTVIQASASARGGIAWDAGSYCGGGWEDGVKAMFLGLAAYLQGVSESIRGTYPSTSYILAPGTHLSSSSRRRLLPQDPSGRT